MAENSLDKRTWSDSQLTAAVAASRSWRGVMRELGLGVTAAGAIRVQVGRRPYSVGNRGRLIPYDPDALDYFFILNGNLTMYLIPSRVLAGRVMVLLRNYSKYIIGDLSSLLKFSASAEPMPSSVGSGQPADDSGASRRDDALELFSREDVPAR